MIEAKIYPSAHRENPQICDSGGGCRVAIYGTQQNPLVAHIALTSFCLGGYVLDLYDVHVGMLKCSGRKSDSLLLYIGD